MILLSGSVNDYKNIFLSGDFYKDVTMIKNIFCRDAILRVREIKIGGKVDVALFYMDGMVNSSLLGETVIESLIRAKIQENILLDCDYTQSSILFAVDVAKTDCLPDMLRAVLYGDTLLVIDGQKNALTIDTKGWRTRGISEPDGERVLQGPREGFDEAGLQNLAMIRRKLLTPDLCIEQMRIGRRSDTHIFICYLGSLADKNTVKRLKNELSKIDIDGILDSNYISEILGCGYNFLFKTTGTTEKPDVVAARLLEGRIAVVVDGTPVVLTLPYLFSENFQSDEDYYVDYIHATFSRLLRYFCFFIAVSVPGVFLALVTHHFDLLPTHFAISVLQLRAGVPIGSATECLVLIFAFEILKESGLRMPQNLSHALSVVGGLVLGQAGVEAKMISTPMLIAVSLSAIAGLMVPNLATAVTYLRVINAVSCAIFGFYGFFTVSVLFLIYLLNIKSFGVDYTISLTKPTVQNLKDTFVRRSWTKMFYRPLFNKNIVRKGEHK